MEKRDYASTTKMIFQSLKIRIRIKASKLSCIDELWDSRSLSREYYLNGGTQHRTALLNGYRAGIFAKPNTVRFSLVFEQ